LSKVAITEKQNLRRDRVLMAIDDNEAQAGRGDFCYYGDGVSI